MNYYTENDFYDDYYQVNGGTATRLMKEVNTLLDRIKELEIIVNACGENICLRCLFTDGYDPEPEPICCGNIDPQDGCCGCPDPDWKACRECQGARLKNMQHGEYKIDEKEDNRLLF